MLESASNIAPSVDSAMVFIVAVSVVLLVLVTFFMVYFAVRYRRSRHPEAEEVEGNVPLEIAWTVIPTIIVTVMFFYGMEGFKLMHNVPADALRIDVTARMWSWLFTYEDGTESTELMLPKDKAVVLHLRSMDVLHSLFIPDFRVKEDAVPGQVTKMWFTAEKTGTFQIFCTEYCGAGHSKMLSKAVVMEPGEFDAWLEEAGKDKVPSGGELLKSKGCLGCHSTDGTRKVGPSFKGIYGRKATVVTGGAEREITSDKEYIVRSITEPEPSADIVKGYPPIMPAGLVSEEEAGAIAEHFEQEGSE
jgi:cytochrome c oxidase subunit 2